MGREVSLPALSLSLAACAHWCAQHLHTERPEAVSERPEAGIPP